MEEAADIKLEASLGMGDGWTEERKKGRLVGWLVDERLNEIK